MLDPDKQVQNTLRYFFETFRRTGAAWATVQAFGKEGLQFPRRGPAGYGELIWQTLRHSVLLEFTDSRRRGIVSDGMNKNFLLCLIGIALVTSCSNSPDTTAVAIAPVATPAPENYGLYSDFDLQIYSQTIDLKIREALKNNNVSQAQELGRKRQELLAEFRRRGLQRKPAPPTEPTRHPTEPTRRPTPRHSTQSQTPNPSRTGLPGQD